MVSPWEKFLSPAVVAAVIAALVTLLTQQKQQMHSYITSERAAWRLRIKEAMQELLTSYGIEQATILALQHVKSELNPYGRMLTNATIETPQHIWNKKKAQKSDANMDYYLKDAHIWDCIKIYESAQICQKKYYLDCLIYQLEYLLKYDWERSKSEVLINIWLSISILCSAGGLACLVVANWPNVQGGEVDIEFLFTSTLVAIFITLCPYLYVKKILSNFQFKLFSFFAIIFLILLGALSFLYPDKEIWFGMSALCFLLELCSIS